MNLGELKTELLGYLADPDGDYTTPAEATTAFNLAQDILELNLNPQAVQTMCPKLIGTDAQTSATGDATYTLPTDFVNAVSLYVGDYQARGPIGPAEWSAVDGSNTWTEAVASDPAYKLMGTEYHVAPTPTDSSTTLSLDYVKQATRLSSDGDNTLFGIHFDEILLNLAAGIRCEKLGTTLEGADQKAMTFTQKGMALIEGINKRYA